MRQYICIAILLIATKLNAAIKVTFPDSFSNGWEPYIGQTIEFTQPLYVCGNYYDSLILSHERLYVPEEHAVGLAQGDSTTYWNIKQNNRSMMLKLSCKITNYQVRTGCTIKKLTAKVVAPGKLVTGATPKFTNNKPAP